MVRMRFTARAVLFYRFAENETENAGYLQNESDRDKKSTRRCFLSNPV